MSDIPVPALRAAFEGGVRLLEYIAKKGQEARSDTEFLLLSVGELLEVVEQDGLKIYDLPGFLQDIQHIIVTKETWTPCSAYHLADIVYHASIEEETKH